MLYEEIPPSLQFRRFIKCFWVMKDSNSASPSPETVLPDGNLEIIFNLADRFRRFHLDGEIEDQPASIAVGQMRRYITIQPSGKVDLFGVRFQSLGAYYYFKRPLSDLTGSIVSLDLLVEKGESDLEEQINAATTTARRIAIFEQAFSRKLRPSGSREQIVNAVMQHICETVGRPSIRQLAREFAISQRQLERHFNEMVGVSPKFYSRIIRLQRILNAPATAGDMFELALANGYYDQSHFIREFTEFAGKSPGAFLCDQNRMSEAFLGG